MKKIFFISIITMISIGVIIYGGTSYISSIPSVSVVQLTAESVENAITASGNLECPKSECVSVTNNMLITEVLVHSGETIEKGTALCKGVIIPDSLLENTDVISTFASNVSDLYGSYEISAMSEQASITVYSDKSGSVSAVSVEKDSYVSSGDTLVALSEQTHNTVILNIPETLIYDIKIGQFVKVSITALPDKAFTGTVTAIADEAKQTVTTSGKETAVEVTVTLNEECKAKNGFSTRCSIITSVEADKILIPYECLDSDQNGDYIFILSEQGKAQKKYVQIEKEYSTGFSIKDTNIHSGDFVIRDTVGLTDNEKVYVKEAVS